MKRIVLMMALTAGVAAANAQTFADNNADKGGNGQGPSASARKEDPAGKVVYANPYSMDYITMDQQDNAIAFNSLPDLSGMTVHVTDASGNEVINRRISRKNNTTDISRLKKGMHYVTLTSENSNSRKTFTLVRE